MILLVHWCRLFLPPLHLGSSNTPLYPPLLSWVLHLSLPTVVHIHVYICWLSCLISFKPHIGHQNCVMLLSSLPCFLTWLMAHHLTLHPCFIAFSSLITMSCVGSCLKIKTKTQEVLTQYLQIYSGFCSWQLSKIYKRITKEMKDPKSSYAINSCSAKLLSKQTESLHVLKSHWPLQKSIINKLYVLLNYLIISNNLISCQT